MLHIKRLEGYRDFIKLSSKAFCKLAKDQLLPYITKVILGDKTKNLHASLPMNWVIDAKWLVDFQLALLYKFNIDSIIFCADLNGKMPSWRIELRPCTIDSKGFSLTGPQDPISSNINSVEKLNEYYLRKFHEHVSFR